MSETLKILFLAANPKDTDQLRLDEEIREIKQALLQAEFRDKFEIEQEFAVRTSDIQAHLLRHKPHIVHFSGHGSEKSEIILEDKTGNSTPLSIRALSQLFSVLKDNIRCVVLNACYSEPQAQAIAKHVDCVIGMSKAIGDPAAISFSVAFYQALGFGRDIKTAFDLGCLQIDLESLNEQDTPKLLAININPQEIILDADIENHQNVQYECKNQSTIELISILTLRADQILAIMNADKEKVLARYGISSRTTSTLNYSDSIRRQFQELHDKHIHAIKNGHLVVAHEILSNIFRLLKSYSEINPDEGVVYSNSKLFPDTISEDIPIITNIARAYPGPLPNNISIEKDLDLFSVIWPTETDYYRSMQQAYKSILPEQTSNSARKRN